MDSTILMAIIGYCILSIIFLVIFIVVKKKKGTTKRREANARNKDLYNNTNMGRVALWIDIELVNNEPLDESKIYYSRVKSNMTGMNENVEVVLFNPGRYTLLVHSREYSNVTLDVVIEAGKVYQLGADNEGPYFILDSDPGRYELTQY